MSRSADPSIGELLADKASSSVREMSRRDIAIIGMAARLPKAENKEQLWKNIRGGLDCVDDLPQVRRDAIEPFSEYLLTYGDFQLKYTVGAYLSDIDEFDYGFFRTSPREASLMDPAHRLFLQCAMEAIEDAGYGGTRLSGTRTGVFVGFAPDFRECNYKDLILRVDHSLAPVVVPANLTAILPTRISYFLDLKGPTICVDTACSSSLVSAHLACVSLRNGESDLAIAGGIKLNLLPLDTGVKIGIESDDGATRPFDDSATGTGVGEGVAAVLLKPLHRAMADGDHIYAVIKGSSINQDGRSMGITAPNPQTQKDVMVRAWEDAGIDPGTLDWIEAHGVATRVGDPIELHGISTALRQYTEKRQFCAITSLKGNINHLFEGAGIASLVKATLSLEHKEIAPTLNFETPNRAFDFIDGPVYVNDTLRPWPPSDHPRRCGVNAFGMSGTNCHMVLEEAPERPRVAPSERPFYVFTLSAQDPDLLSSLVQRYRSLLDRCPELEVRDVCHTASVGRGHYEHRLAFVVTDLADLRARLDHCQGRDLCHPDDPRAWYGAHKLRKTTERDPDMADRTRTDLEISEEDQANMTLEAEQCVEGALSGEDIEARLARLCGLYVQGADVDWPLLYREETVRRVPLPTYPFARTRCIFEPPPDALRTLVENRTLHYECRWVPKDMGPSSGISGSVLLLTRPDQGGLARQVHDMVRQRGLAVVRATVADASDASLCATQAPGDLSCIVHLQSLGLAPVTDEASLIRAESLGPRSLYHLLRALHSAGHTSFQLALVADHTTEVDGTERVLKPENAALLGMGKVIGREIEGVRCLAVDVDDDVRAQVILDELGADPGVYHRAHRRGKRYVEMFAAVDFDRHPLQPLHLTQGGLYLVTGGTGGLGLAVAEDLSRQAQVKLALLSRTGMPAPGLWDRVVTARVDRRVVDRIQAVRRILGNGSHVEVPVGDISDRDHMKRVISDLRARHGRICGIVHCAGAPPTQRLLDKPQEELDTVMSPKTLGTLLLDELTRPDEPDFMILYSSVATIFPVAGQADYGAANAYLDTFAQQRTRRGQYTLAVNWVAWKDIGMAADTGIAVDTIVKAISPVKALPALRRAVEHRLTNTMIGALNYNDDAILLIEKYPVSLSEPIGARLDTRRGSRMGAPPKRAAARRSVAKLTGRRSGRYSTTERALAALWEEALGIEELDVFASFYELGGDSVQALRIVNSIQEKLRVELKISDALANPTLAGLAKVLDEDYLANEDGQGEDDSIPVIAARERYPLTAQQHRLFALHTLDPEATTYNMPTVCRVEGDLDSQRLERAVAGLVERHRALRTCFVEEHGEVVQKVAAFLEPRVEYCRVMEREVGSTLRALVLPFDLGTPPLFRVALLSLSDREDCHYLFFDSHHLVSDGASVAILVEDFSGLYADTDLSVLPVRYTDYAVWQPSQLSGEQIDRQRRYWLSQFEGGVPRLNLSTDLERPQVPSSTGSREMFSVDQSTKERLKALALANETTLYVMLLAAYAVLLGKYANQHPLALGIVVTNRNRKELERVVGLFTNTLALKLDPAHGEPFSGFAQQVRKIVSEALDHQDYPFDRLVTDLGLQSRPDQTPLFSTLFALHNLVMKPIEIGDISIRFQPSEATTSKFDFHVELFEQNDSIEGFFEYRTDLFSHHTIKTMIQDYCSILDTVLHRPNVLIGEIRLSLDDLATAEAPAMEDIDFDL